MKEEAVDFQGRAANKGKERDGLLDKRPGDDHKPGKANAQTVFDPITRDHVQIADATHADLLNAFQQDEAQQQQQEQQKEGNALQHSPKSLRRDQINAVPVQRGNVLFYPHPPIHWKQHHAKSRSIIARYVAFAALVSLVASLHSTIGPALVGIAIALGGVYALRMLDASFEDCNWDTERQRGQKAASECHPESAEWLNGLIEKIWPLIDNSLFMAVTDQLEDIMQATVPKVIESVKIVEMHQGRTPMRILSMRSLPNEDMHEIMAAQGKSKEEMAKEEQEQVGEFVNIEASFAYRAQPSRLSISSKAGIARLLIEFFIGVKKLSAIKMPVYVGLEGIVGTMRARIHLTPDPPFAREVTVSLMGLPRVEISAIPLWQRLPNIMGLPLISNFVESSIDKAMGDFCAPRSLSVDVAELLIGDGFRKSLDTFGILLVNIHRAEGLAKTDTRGSSDPYVVLHYSRLSRPIFSTRIIVDDLNPHWKETAVILVHDEEIKADEQLSAQLWDSDRFSPDDQLGHITVSLRELIRNRGKTQHREDELVGDAPDERKPGRLFWDVAFFGLHKLDLDDPRATDGHDPRIPEDLRQQEPELGMHGLYKQNPYFKTPPVMVVPPDPEFPSGILHVAVIQIAELGFKDQRGTYGRRGHGTRGQEKETEHADAHDEHDEDVPSSYVNIHLNDQPIYRTRVKPLSSNAVFNAGCERFVPDWRVCEIMFVVRQKNVREADSLLGVLPIRLADLLKNASCVTQWYPISGGVGFGRIRIGVLFRSIEAKLPRTMLSYNVGTLHILSDIRVYDFADPSAKSNIASGILKLETLGCSYKAKQVTDKGDKGLEFSTQTDKPPLRLPLEKRDASSLLIEARSSKSRLRRSTLAVARQWIRDLVSDEEITLRLPLYTSSNMIGYIQNHIDERHMHRYELKQVATVEMKVVFRQGLGDAHRSSKLMKQPEQKMLLEAWDAAISSGLRLRCVTGITPSTPKTPGSDSASSSGDDLETVEDAGVMSKPPSENMSAMKQLLSPVLGRRKSNTSLDEPEKTKSQVSTEELEEIQRERSKSQFRTEQRGVHHSKAVRSASWIGQGVKKRASQLAHSLEHKGRTPDVFEKEGGVKGTLHAAT